MTGALIIDTGPIVAFLDHRDRHHDWAKTWFKETRSTFLTCEAVITEACFLLRKVPGLEGKVMDFVTRGVFVIGFRLEDEASAVAKLMERYANVPMSLADACLVRMAELYDPCRLLTLDGDFRVYRKQGKVPIAAILPEDRV